jgi:hypothetical protein
MRCPANGVNVNGQPPDRCFPQSVAAVEPGQSHWPFSSDYPHCLSEGRNAT